MECVFAAARLSKQRLHGKQQETDGAAEEERASERETSRGSTEWKQHHGEYSAVCTCSPPSTQCRGSCFLTNQCVDNTAVRWAQCGTHSKDSHQEDALSAFTALLSGRPSVLCERLCL